MSYSRDKLIPFLKCWGLKKVGPMQNKNWEGKLAVKMFASSSSLLHTAIMLRYKWIRLALSFLRSLGSQISLKFLTETWFEWVLSSSCIDGSRQFSLLQLPLKHSEHVLPPFDTASWQFHFKWGSLNVPWVTNPFLLVRRQRKDDSRGHHEPLEWNGSVTGNATRSPFANLTTVFPSNCHLLRFSFSFRLSDLISLPDSNLNLPR